MSSNSKRPPDSPRRGRVVQRRTAQPRRASRDRAIPVPGSHPDGLQWRVHAPSANGAAAARRVPDQGTSRRGRAKLGTSRRQFLLGSGGMAAAFIAMNEVYGKKFFTVNRVEMYETAAYREHGTPPDVFVSSTIRCTSSGRA